MRLALRVRGWSPLQETWVAITALIGFDAIMCHHLGWTLTNWTAPIVPFFILAVIAFGYGLSGRSPGLARAAGWLLAWTSFSLSGVVLSYIGAASTRPVYDAIFARLDLVIGFHWQDWFYFVSNRPILTSILTAGYASLMLQIILSVLYFCWRGTEDKNAALMLNVFIATLATIAIFAIFPALGPSYAVPLLHNASDTLLTNLRDRNGIAELLALRDGTFATIDLSHLKGVVSFPSLHTVLAIVLTHSHLRSWLFTPVLLLNGLMVLSVPVIGGHYLVDVIAGAAVAGATILLTRPLRRYFRTNVAAAHR